MNEKKWKRRSELGLLSREEWLAKLAEEFGEVARCVVDIGAKGVAHGDMVHAERHLLLELQHVEFIAQCMRTSIVRQMQDRVHLEEGVTVDG